VVSGTVMVAPWQSLVDAVDIDRTFAIVLLTVPEVAGSVNDAVEPMVTPVVVQPVGALASVTVTVTGNGFGLLALTTRSPPALVPFAVSPG
jgi:hypothetical protein